MKPILLLPLLGSLAWGWSCWPPAIQGPGAYGVCWPSSTEAQHGGHEQSCFKKSPCTKKDHVCVPNYDTWGRPTTATCSG
ncbi:hypothetical protein EJ03DRAFT_325719 [Teratosphaeria nubilosa]|uniref:CBM1 domain-containing protein n=1 Tax=Teratosphaeria nubilosa TaxID=161662 RepID=A0A6G1LEI5_9PEZI|nr:hypothetical protein EJ03DRAFT_325719 [Teratosphaeria nubilosa]